MRNDACKLGINKINQQLRKINWSDEGVKSFERDWVSFEKEKVIRRSLILVKKIKQVQRNLLSIRSFAMVTLRHL